jgi:hypothetical protein
MSKDQKAVAVAEVSKFSIVNKIVAFFQLGDAGKLTGFFARIHKQLDRETEGLKKSISNAQHNAGVERDTLNDKLEDAKEALEEAYLQVDVDDVNTNEKQVNYVEVYLTNISKAQSVVTVIEAELEVLEEALKEKVAEYQAEIDSRKVILDSLK